MWGRVGMERLPGQDEEPSTAEARAPAPPGEDGPPRPRGRAGLAAAAAIFGFATVALAYRATPWHRAAALVEIILSGRARGGRGCSTRSRTWRPTRGRAPRRAATISTWRIPASSGWETTLSSWILLATVP
ncbi:unnamed protein product [Prorocentrum cordatum]|uniref:Mannosyltransferase n=1 Tax=Prorocentrum cordatum TaxID=2364126 RepID=A0ABN9Y517_9DINO|nr:unnamed protein product [Polarella glacialis]